jgi:hypothetical protein
MRAVVRAKLSKMCDPTFPDSAVRGIERGRLQHYITDSQQNCQSATHCAEDGGKTTRPAIT